ncbi:hypothetical protein J2128_000235 [Methanomicrobium sp. W14]|uniref:hypothetical protein n=1 Tax=Methanomicrobium sp. W14 TaxID=2817839 RepID=UPI001AE14932|nr:hypothetical protein [Methanomicrobium sp. W14]MBP2132314.1 hypothetical protein [Methanomicrobium sp. W14]
MKRNLSKYIAVGSLLFLFFFVATSGCTFAPGNNSQNSTGDLYNLLNKAEERLYSIDWNSESPGNIRSQILASETDIKNIFDTLSSMQPKSSEDSEKIYVLRALSCSYLDMTASMMDLTNVIEHYNSAEYYASLYDNHNWEMEVLTADDALASARNNLYSAKYRISGVNMNMVPIDYQGDVTEMKVRIDEMETLMDNLADEFSRVQ